MKDLGIRTVVAIALLASLGAIVWFGGWVQVGALTVLSSIAVFEMGRMFKKKEIHICYPPLFIIALGQYALLYKLPKYLPALYAFCFIWVLADRILCSKRSSEDTVATLFTVIYPLALFLCFGFFGYDSKDVSRVALLMVFASPCMADNNAYIFGSLLGKHKLCPKISPNKTVEGFIAGIIGGPLGGVIVYFLQKIWGPEVQVHWAWLVGIGFAGGFIGQLGDLFASTFKRWSGIKDFGKIFSKHGGVMDRLDSALAFAPFVAAVFYYLIRK